MKRLLLVATVALVAVGLLAATGLARKDDAARGWLGVYTQSVDYDLAEAFNLDTPYGAVVNEVIEDSPADKAGLREGDVIISLNGEKITDSDDLVDVMHETSPGDRLDLVVVRKGKEMTFTFDAGSVPADEEDRSFRDLRWFSPGARIPSVVVPNFQQTYLGVSLNDLSEQLGDYFGAKDGEGALITEVTGDSPAEKAGLKAGDVIVEIDGEPVADAQDVTEAIHDHEDGDRVVVTVIRNQQTEKFTAELESREGQFYGFGSTVSPDVAILNVPKLRGLYRGNYDAALDEYFDSEEFQREMEKLQEELGKMKFEFKDLDELEIDREELRRDLEELRRELKEMKLELQRELEELRDQRQ